MNMCTWWPISAFVNMLAHGMIVGESMTEQGGGETLEHSELSFLVL